ncbi:MAG: hypothetical protein QMD44_07150 [Thermodesulfovibrionales bacterium]|nr:hypothetical protein [Thermodesulfovibrionales bacterium]
MRKLNSRSTLLCTAMVILYCLLYEWVNIFDIPYIKTYVNALKLILPFTLFFVSSSSSLPNFSLPKNYLLYFVLFMIWALVPNVLSGHISETMMQWLKLIPRLIFCYVIFAYLLQRPEAKAVITKALVVVAVGTVLQYVILSIFHYPGDPSGFSLPIFRKVTYYGPYGLLGSGTANIYIQSIDLELFRLTGFWSEPSTASGFLFMAFFLAKVLFEQTQQRRWKLAGLACLGGGLLAFSNAGHFAFGSALLAGHSVQFNEKKNDLVRYIVKMAILLVYIFLSLFGRYIVAKYYPDNMDLRYVSGVRDSVKSPYGGRIEQTESNIKVIFKHPQGIGLRIPGRYAEGRGFDYVSFAPAIWLLSTGWIGLFLLLMRESQVLRLMWKHLFSSNSLSIFQAWVALFCQNLIYGTWMTPLYFLLVAMVFAATYYRYDTDAGMQGYPS